MLVKGATTVNQPYGCYIVVVITKRLLLDLMVKNLNKIEQIDSVILQI